MNREDKLKDIYTIIMWTRIVGNRCMIWDVLDRMEKNVEWVKNWTTDAETLDFDTHIEQVKKIVLVDVSVGTYYRIAGKLVPKFTYLRREKRLMIDEQDDYCIDYVYWLITK